MMLIIYKEKIKTLFILLSSIVMLFMMTNTLILNKEISKESTDSSGFSDIEFIYKRDFFNKKTSNK